MAAAAAGVSGPMTDWGEAVLNSGTPELIQAVADSEISVRNAAKIAKLPKEEQADAIKVAPKSRKPAKKREPIPAIPARQKKLISNAFRALALQLQAAGIYDNLAKDFETLTRRAGVDPSKIF